MTEDLVEVVDMNVIGSRLDLVVAILFVEMLWCW